LRASTPVPQPATVISLNNVNRLVKLAEWNGAGIWIAFSPDSKLLATAGIELSLWDVSSGREVRVFTGHTSPVTGIALSPDGRILASRARGGEGDNTLRLWNVSSGHELHTVVLAPRPEMNKPVTFSPDGALVATGSGTRIHLYEVTSGRELLAPSDTGSVTSLAFSPDGKLLASASEMVQLWDTSSGSEVCTLAVDGVAGLAFSPDGKLLATGWELWEVNSGRKLRTFDPYERIGKLWSIALSPDGKLLAWGTGVQKLFLWDVASGSLLYTLPVTDQQVVSLAFSPDGKLLASGAADGTVWLWGVK
jgi:WD40 repeat protein